MCDRVSANAKGNRDRRGRSFGRERRRIANRSDNADATADEVGHERRQAVVFAVQPMVLHRHVLALYVAAVSVRPLLNALAQRAEPSSDRLLTKPIPGMDCCGGRAPSGHAAAAPPRSVMNSRRLIQ